MFTVACMVLLVASAIALGKDLSNKELGRLLLIRGLDREIAVAKVPLPRGKHGLFLNEKGQVDKERAKEEFRKNGTAIQPGMPVEITKIKFKRHSIVFQINNGGKKGKKWYQHIEIGMGGMMQPIDQQQQQNPIAYGSSITLKLHDEKGSDLSPEEAKKLLSTVLDFHRKSPTELYSPNIPKKFKEAIRKHEVLVGMNRDAVLSSKGVPFRKVRETKPNGPAPRPLRRLQRRYRYLGPSVLAFSQPSSALPNQTGSKSVLTSQPESHGSLHSQLTSTFLRRPSLPEGWANRTRCRLRNACPPP
ncbi:MAG: hypothetical protein P8Z30_17585 [Acidobacteriota bacterium]